MAFFHIVKIGNGQLYISPRPDAEALQSWCADVRSTGIDRVVSLIAVDEVDRYGLAEEAALLAARDVSFENYPIKDFGVPGRERLRCAHRRATRTFASG